LHFFYGKASEGLGEKILSFANIQKNPVLLVLNIPEGQKTISEDATAFETFASAFLGGSTANVGLKD
jgi:hypothetical protein